MVAASAIVIHDRRYANDEIGGLDHLASWIIQFNSIRNRWYMWYVYGPPGIKDLQWELITKIIVSTLQKLITKMFWHANHVYLTNMDRQVAMGNDSTVKFCVADTSFLKWNPGR